jgi:outer membrane protein OmpA-like peptidoglycan-associated protein
VKITGEKEEILSEIAGINGEIFLCLPLGDNYAFHVSEDGYLFYSQSFSLIDKKSSLDPYLLDIELEPVEVGAEMELYNIYFETDSFAILPQSDPELQKLATFLTQNRALTVEIQGHTDNTGIAEKNRHLSELRARSVVEYLQHSGIEKNRMQWKGYGSEKPVSDNETQEGRSLNRRTTIKITGR